MPKSGLRCDEIFLSRVDADKTDPPTKNVACFAGQTHGMFGRRIWAGQVVDAPKETCRCALPRERCRSIFGCGWRQPSEFDPNQTEKKDGEPAVLQPPEDFRRENGQDEIRKVP